MGGLQEYPEEKFQSICHLGEKIHWVLSERKTAPDAAAIVMLIPKKNRIAIYELLSWGYTKEQFS